ncbi:MAG: hypothetical protein J6Y36_00595 [Treponema sp.]|nr:hypothetical protein [Treponema sp.]
MKKVFLPLLTVLFLTLTGCEVGMGEALDLEAPEVTISTPQKFSYQPLSFSMAGTCKDNIRVESVVISNKETGKVYGKASITGNNWTFDLNLTPEDEGELTLLVEANDKLKNTSTHSARTITLLVDENAPVAKSWYVDRGNAIQTPLEEKQFLEDLDFNLAVNKNWPQNEEFTIYGSFYDAMGIDTITVKLFEDSYSTINPVAQKTVNANSGNSNYIGDGKSIYSPSFKFTQADLVNGNGACSAGKHYLRVVYYAKDNDDPVNFNDNEVDTEQYILWYPESDKPGVQQTEVEIDASSGKEKLRASVGSAIPVDFFDDDALREIHLALKNSISGTIENYTNSLIANASTRTTAFTAGQDQPVVSKTDFPTASNQTDYNTQIVAPEKPGQMYLIAAAKDIRNKWNARVIPVEVVDSAKPMLFVEKPTENETPEMETGSDRKFKFTGYSLDTKGSKYIKIAYIPTRSEERAKQLFETYKDNTEAKKVISGTGEVIWYQAITGGTTTTDNWKKQEFSIEMNLFEDFKNASGVSTAKEEKFFEILLADTDGNKVFKPFIINGDSLQPLIDIALPQKELDVHDYTVNDLVIRFKGYKPTGIGMDASKYKITTKIGTTDYEYKVGTGSPKITAPDSDGYVSLTIPKATLATWVNDESQPTFTFYATDILGNGGIGEDMRSVILSPRPVIEAIDVNKNSGTYKKDDVLEFKVSFSKQVKVTGTPKLKIRYDNGDTTPKYATYTSGSQTNSLNFIFTVPEDAVSNGIICDGFALAKDTDSSVTDENKLADSAKICATELGEGDAYTKLPAGKVLEGKEIKLDGVTPFIKSISVTALDGNNYCTKDKKITAVITMSEPILVSGNPELVLKVGTSDLKFNFEQMGKNTVTGDTEITFVHKVVSTGTNKSPEGNLRYVLNSCFTSAHKLYLTDNAGNVVDLNKNNGFANTAIWIDYTAPTNSPSINLTSKTYNESKDLELSGIETDASGTETATGYYSTDGGVSWTAYDKDNKETLGNGTYKIITYQLDRAGNKSSESSPVNVVINSIFAPITNFSIDLADGNYKENTEFTFTLNFEEKVVINNASDITLTFETMETGGTATQTVNAEVPAGNQTNTVTFKYKVDESDYFKGVKVKEITFANNFKDVNGNAPSYATTPKKLTQSNCTYLSATDGGTRSGIVLDGIAPTITAYTPANGGVASMTDNSSGSFKITLTFDGPVAKETGNIILQRKGNWAIPAVMKNDEFLKYYNKMSAANKTIVRRLGADGDDLKHGRTGIEVGPYRRITHGLISDGTYYVPDTETKFVLAYDLGLYEGSASLNNGTETGTFTVTVAQIRSALESVGYHQHKVDVASDFVKITGNKVEITFAETVEDGREWELIIPNTAFRDDAENFYRGMNVTGATDNYSLWSNNVAKPVVRVDRYTHGWGAHEPNSDGTFTDITVNNGKFTTNELANSSAKVAPTGYARARIDCETPGVAIKYSKLGINGTAWTDAAPAGVAYNATGGTAENSDYHTNSRHILDDITESNLNKRGAQTYTANSDIIVGDGTYTTARKDYITAYATKSGFADSANGFEGIFKTIVYIKSNSNVSSLNVEGGTSPGGQPNVFGFPLRDATDEDDPTGAGRYSKNCYIITSRTQFVFVSYEIISNDWAILLCGGNHARSYPLNSYGGSAYITKQNFWSGNNVTNN